LLSARQPERIRALPEPAHPLSEAGSGRFRFFAAARLGLFPVSGLFWIGKQIVGNDRHKSEKVRYRSCNQRDENGIAEMKPGV